MNSGITACIPVTPDGRCGGGFGRAPLVAIVRVQNGAVTGWREIPVGWDVLHDTTTEGGHHARVARFLIDHEVQLVVVNHLGDGMRRMLDGLGVTVSTGAVGAARLAVLEAAAGV